MKMGPKLAAPSPVAPSSRVQIQPSGQVRCEIIRMMGGIPIQLGVKIVKMSQSAFYVKVSGEWLGFLIDLDRVYKVAPQKIWLGFRTVQMPCLIFNIDEATPMYYQDARGKRIQEMFRWPQQMMAGFMPSEKLGDIKKREVYFQGMKAQQKRGGEGFNSQMLMMIIVGIAIGFVVGMVVGPNIIHTGTITTVTTVTSTTSSHSILAPLPIAAHWLWRKVTHR